MQEEELSKEYRVQDKGDRIRRLAIEFNMDIARVAKVLGISQRQVLRRIIRPEHKNTVRKPKKL
jgi:AraC-like DNA-binding protein